MSADKLTLADLWQFTRSLKLKPPQDVTFDELYSFLQEKTKKARRPTADHIRFARELGIRIDPELHTALYVGAVIDAKNNVLGQAIIDKNKALRSGNTIMYEGISCKITRLASVNGPWRVWLKFLTPESKSSTSVSLVQVANARLATVEEIATAKQAKKV